MTQQELEKEFVPYDQALALKELGFDEPCFGFYNDMENNKPMGGNFPCDGRNSAPLYQQAFRWLYQKLGIEKGVMPLDTESQQLLLKELIDKMSSKHSLV